MTTAEKEFCNRALARIDSSQIGDADTTSKQYELCAQFLDTAIQEALSRTEWAEASGLYDFIVYESPDGEYDYISTVPSNVHDIMSTSGTRDGGYGRYKRIRSSVLFKNHTGTTPPEFVSGNFYIKGLTFYCPAQKLTVEAGGGTFEVGDIITSAAGEGTIIAISGLVYTVRYITAFSAADTIAVGAEEATVVSIESTYALYRSSYDGVITTATVDTYASTEVTDSSGMGEAVITAMVLYNDATLDDLSDDLKRLCELTLAKILSIPLSQNRSAYSDILVEIENVVLPELRAYTLNREMHQRQYKHDYIYNSLFQR